MKLWLLKPNDDLEYANSPWNPGFDKTIGFVVREETEEKARVYAAEGTEYEFPIYGAFKINPWLQEIYTTCIELREEGEEGIILLYYIGS